MHNRHKLTWKGAKGIPTKGIGKNTESHEFQGVSGHFQGIIRVFSGFFQGIFQVIVRLSSGCFQGVLLYFAGCLQGIFRVY